MILHTRSQINDFQITDKIHDKLQESLFQIFFKRRDRVELQLYLMTAEHQYLIDGLIFTASRVVLKKHEILHEN